MSIPASPLVLVVEDDESQANAMLGALQDAGMTVMAAPGIREAIFKVKNQKFSCIILDLLLGQEKGEHLLEVIRTRKDIQNTDTPIFVISAHLDKDTLQRLAGKVQGALVKPFDMQAFAEQVKKIAK